MYLLWTNISHFVISKKMSCTSSRENNEWFSITLTLLGNLYKYVVVFVRLRYFAWILVKSLTRSEFFVTLQTLFSVHSPAAHSSYLHTPDCTKYLMVRHSQQRSHRVISLVRCLSARHDTATRRVGKGTRGMPIYRISCYLYGACHTATTEPMATNYSDCTLLSIL